MSIFDFFTREAGQERRRAIEGLLTQFIPPEMRPQLGLLAEAQPIRGAERAGQGAVRVMNTQGMDRVQAIGDTLSEMAGVVAPAMVAGRAGVPVANAVQDVLTGYSPMVQPFLADESGALRLYHGSPHDFDRFSMSKIGTGEGAQAYGHGLYFAENEGVARGYRDALTSPVDYQGKGYPGADSNLAAKKVADAMGPNSAPANVIASEASKYRYQAQQLRAKLEGQSGAARDANERLAASFEQIASDIEGLNPNDFALKSGRMYEVNVNANPEDFLDWDLPLSQQPKSVRDALGPRVDALRQAGSGLPHDPVGEMLWRVAHPQGGFDKTDFSRSVPEQATERLREAGIPGIRYLDAGSRGAGDGSRNYVVFDENLIEIVRKYGIAGAAAMLGMSQADVAQAMQQQPQPQGLLTGPQ